MSSPSPRDTKRRLSWHSHAISDVGKVRKHNEERFFTLCMHSEPVGTTSAVPPGTVHSSLIFASPPLSRYSSRR